MDFNQAKVSFLDHCLYEKKLSSKTIEFYTIDLDQFLRFLMTLDMEIEISGISKEEIKLYLKQISVFKPKTIKRKLATLKALFNYLEFEDYITINPFRKMRIKIKEPKVNPTVMDASEVKSIFKAAYKDREEAPDNEQLWLKYRDIALIELLFATGMRVSELTSLKRDQINLETGRIRIFGKGSKERVIQVFNPETLKAIREYVLMSTVSMKEEGFFFINRLHSGLSDQTVRHVIRKFTALANLQKHITPHTFRHTFATLLLEADVDIKYIQHFLGHSSIATTQIYTHVSTNKQKQILTEKHPRNAFEFR